MAGRSRIDVPTLGVVDRRSYQEAERIGRGAALVDRYRKRLHVYSSS